MAAWDTPRVDRRHSSSCRLACLKVIQLPPTANANAHACPESGHLAAIFPRRGKSLLANGLYTDIATVRPGMTACQAEAGHRPKSESEELQKYLSWFATMQPRACVQAPQSNALAPAPPRFPMPPTLPVLAAPAHARTLEVSAAVGQNSASKYKSERLH